MKSLNLPLITIVTPSLNQGDFIEHTIRSVLSQDYPRLEYIIMDGGSTDDTHNILKRYSTHVKWQSKKDKGQTEAINNGIKLSVGEIISYLNADDVLLPNSLHTVGNLFISHENVQWLTGRCRILDERGNTIRSVISLYKNMFLKLHSRRALLITNYISQPATFLRRSLVESCGLFDEQLHFVMDYEYWLRAWGIAPPMILDIDLAGFRIQRNAKTTATGHSRQYVAEEKLVIARHTDSRFWRFLHDAHRLLMTKAYSRINR